MKELKEKLYKLASSERGSILMDGKKWGVGYKEKWDCYFIQERGKEKFYMVSAAGRKQPGKFRQMEKQQKERFGQRVEIAWNCAEYYFILFLGVFHHRLLMNPWVDLSFYLFFTITIISKY